MLGIASKIKDEVRATARSAVLSLAGAILTAVGLGFLTLALWLFLLTVGSALAAAVIIGAIYCGAGFILLAVAASGKGAPGDADLPDPEAPPAPPPKDPFFQMAEGFAVGLQAGRAAGRPPS